MSDYPKREFQPGDLVTWQSATYRIVGRSQWPDREFEDWVIEDDKGGCHVVAVGGLSPLPSPDDIVQVTVEMTRRERDRLAEGDGVGHIVGDATRAACKAHRDAEEAP